MAAINYMKKFQDDAGSLKSSLNVSGRFSFQKAAMKRVVPDIAKKLELRPDDSLLDIGCNCGDITIPLSFLCGSVLGIDGESCIKRLEQRSLDIENITTLTGNFLDITLQQKFDCVLLYSVLVYCDTFDEVEAIVLKGASLLADGGRMLVGDIVNSDKKTRFDISALGKQINQEYKAGVAHGTKEDDLSHKGFTGGLRMNDRMVMELITHVREAGYEAYLLPQSGELPFGYTREDILIRKLV